MKKKIILFLSYEAVLYIVFSFKMYFLISFIMSKVKISYDIRINIVHKYYLLLRFSYNK